MGADKAFIEIDGVPLWRRQLEILEDLRPHELFIAGPAHDVWREANCIVIEDAESGAGPLAGIVAGLRRCSAPLLLTIAIDLPNITSDYLRALVDACSDDCGIVPSDGDRFEPLAALYPKRSLPLAENCLASHDLSVQRFAVRCISEGLVNAKSITAAERTFFLNMNTPDDLALASAGASHGDHSGARR